MNFVLVSSDMSEARSYRDYASYYGDRGMVRDYRQTGNTADMLGAFSDWDRSGGYGGGCCCGGGYGGQGGLSSYFSDGTLIALLAAGALAFYILWTQVNAQAAAGGTFRKRRGIRTRPHEDDEDYNQFEMFGHTLWKGR